MRYVIIQVEEVVKETDLAVLLRIDGEDHWIPKSQISPDSEYVEAECDLEIEVTKWIASEKGLE